MARPRERVRVCVNIDMLPEHYNWLAGRSSLDGHKAAEAYFRNILLTVFEEDFNNDVLRMEDPELWALIEEGE